MHKNIKGAFTQEDHVNTIGMEKENSKLKAENQRRKSKTSRKGVRNKDKAATRQGERGRRKSWRGHRWRNMAVSMFPAVLESKELFNTSALT